MNYGVIVANEVDKYLTPRRQRSEGTLGRNHRARLLRQT